nr:serine/threonine-protein kinase M1 [Polyrhizophydium stewartii]
MDNRDLLMSVLDMFKHDPLREWSSSRGRGMLCNVHTREEQEKANRVLQVVDWKLHGEVDNAKEPPPIKEQVDRLISEATSATNLSRMYIGWVPFL